MAEELDYETLNSLLKERNKEVKALSIKLKKVEERYIAKHREHGEINSDRDSLIKFASSVLSISLNKKPGEVNLEELEERWASKEREYRQELVAINTAASDEIQKMRLEVSRLNEMLKEREGEVKELRMIELDYNRAFNESEEFRKELEYMEKQIETLRIENAKLRTQQDEFSRLKTNTLIAALEQRPQEQNEEFNKLRTQLAEANSKIHLLETELQAREESSHRQVEVQKLVEDLIAQRASQDQYLQSLQGQFESLKGEFAEHRKKAQKIVVEKDQNVERLRRKVKELERPSMDNDHIAALKLRILELEKAQSRGTVNMEYLKNIVLKYMEYMYAGNYKEAQTLCLVIFTVLDFTQDEIELVRLARESNSFLKNITEFFSVKSPGTGLSYNTLHTIEGRKRANLSIDSIE